LTLTEQGEPALDLIKSGRKGRREMEVEARPGSEPSAHFGMFLRNVIVDDKMDVEGRRDIGVDMVEKGDELLVATTCATAREDSAVGNVQGCKQGRRAIPNVLWVTTST
jgi:hypothetical protein